MSGARCLLSIALVVASGACSLIEGYPDLVNEEGDLCADGVDNDFDGDLDCQDLSCESSLLCNEAGADGCADGLDNDGDGMTDCQDPGCDGVCPEGGVASCRDGRDNDGDGAFDTADPGCFTSGSAITEERCASARQTEWAARDLLAGALGVRDVELFPSDDVPLRLGPSALVVGNASSTGAIEGLEITMEVRGAPGVMRYVQLVEPTVGSDGPMQGLSIGTDGGGAIHLRSGDAAQIAYGAPTVPAPVDRIVARIRGDVFRVIEPESLYDEEGAPTTLEVPLPELLRDGTPLSVRIRGELAIDDGSPRLDVTRLSLRRPAYHPCLDPNPSLLPPTEAEVLAVRYDSTQELLCALVTEGRSASSPGTLVAHVSDDQGATWERATTVASEAPDAAALAWDPEAEQFVALLASADGAALRARTSPGCVSFRDTPAPSVEAGSMAALAYEITDDGAHRMLTVSGSELVVWASPDGAPDGFAEERRLPLDETVGADEVHQLMLVHGHVVVAHRPPGAVGLGLAMDRPDGTVGDSGLRLLEGTGLLGSVDRAGIEWARFALRPPFSGSALRFTVLYGGLEGTAPGTIGDHVATAGLVVQ